MYLFVIQSKGKLPLFDFGFETIKAIEYNHFFDNYNYDYLLAETYEDAMRIIIPQTKWESHKVIPVGSLQFVFSFLDGKVPNAINIPNELMKPSYLGREVSILKRKDIHHEKPFFLKELKYKGFTDIVDSHNGIPAMISSEEEVLISELIDIESEYRCFIFENQLLDIKNYQGNPFVVPSEIKIKEMIHSYEKASPSAYSLDVAVLSNGETVVVEVHPFVSVGLYGFNNYKYLIPMIVRGYNFLNTFRLQTKKNLLI